MKLLKRTLCTILMISVVLSLSACSASKLSHEKFCKFFNSQDLDECEDYNDYTDIFGKVTKEVGGYITLKDKKAQKFYEKHFNRTKMYPDCDVTEATSAYVADRDGYTYIFIFTIEDTKDAEKLFKKYSRSLEEDGEEKDLQYAFTYAEKSNKREVFKAAYLNKNTILIIQANTKDMDFVEDLCEEFKLPNDF